MSIGADHPLPGVIRIVEPGLLEMLLKSQAEWLDVPPEKARQQLELLWHSDPVFRSALQGLFRHVVDTLRVREARDESARQVLSWMAQDWKQRVENSKETTPG